MGAVLNNTITSMEVAQMVGKEHAKLLRDIRNYSEHLAEAKIGLGDFFRETTYQDANNQVSDFICVSIFFTKVAKNICLRIS